MPSATPLKLPALPPSKPQTPSTAHTPDFVYLLAMTRFTCTEYEGFVFGQPEDTRTDFTGSQLADFKILDVPSPDLKSEIGSYLALRLDWMTAV
jgi:hypothetical protein